MSFSDMVICVKAEYVDSALEYECMRIDGNCGQQY